jgi:hypothetical protein
MKALLVLWSATTGKLAAAIIFCEDLWGNVLIFGVRRVIILAKSLEALMSVNLFVQKRCFVLSVGISSTYRYRTLHGNREETNRFDW